MTDLDNTQPGVHHARPTTTEHDSDAWETVSGWIWCCRTCLARGHADSEADARARQAKHDAGPLPWWWPLITRSQPHEPTTTTTEETRTDG